MKFRIEIRLEDGQHCISVYRKFDNRDELHDGFVEAGTALLEAFRLVKSECMGLRLVMYPTYESPDSHYCDWTRIGGVFEVRLNSNLPDGGGFESVVREGAREAVEAFDKFVARSIERADNRKAFLEGLRK